MNDFISIVVSQTKLEEMKNFYRDYLLENNGDYIYFFARKNDVIITGYSSNKNNKTVTFQGPSALIEAQLWDINAQKTETKKKITKEGFLDFNDQIGSDEVGVGDLFLPMIVVSAYIKKSQMSLFLSLNVHDSKKMTDEQILKIGYQLFKTFPHSILTLPNQKYNEQIDLGENINSLKAKMHNRALSNLVNKYPKVKHIYIDQFVNEDTYYSYLENEQQVLKNITFKTKGESFYPCVALASVMARFIFLTEKQKLEEKYHLSFPFGANVKVDQFLKEFLDKFGIEETNKLVKKNFKNYQLILASLKN